MGRTVVVLGAGIGGLCVAEVLGHYLPDGDRVVLVDQCDRQTLGLSLLWVMRGWRKTEQVQTRIEKVSRRGLDFVRGAVEVISPQERRVQVGGKEIAYDALVIALGAELDVDAMPGLGDALRNGAPAGEYFSVEGAAALADRMRRFEGGRLCVVVTRLPFRCPAAPYEGALLLADRQRERGQREATTIEVFTPEPLPMPVAGPEVGRALASLLAERGVTFHPQVELEGVDARSRELHFGSGQRETYDFLVAVPPHRPPQAVVEAKFSASGWVPVHPRTMATPAEAVWAVGDVTALVLANGKNLPKAGVFSRHQAEAAARAVARHFGYDAPEPWFSGQGACFVEVGEGMAAYGSGDFLAEPGPRVELSPPSIEHHRAKEAEEAGWIARWRT
jgi:sulfide:quinone oxidoreductase